MVPRLSQKTKTALMKHGLHSYSLAGCFLLLTLCVGCEKQPEFGKVTGTVTMDGKPLDLVRVLFMPDPNSGNSGSHSECITDDDGRYDLLYSKDAEVHGALTGWHVIVVEDIKAEELRGGFTEIRVPEKYSRAAQSPLRLEVKPEDQEFEIQIQ